MEVNNSLLQGIKQRLSRIDRTLALRLPSATTTSDLFEYYIFSLIITAAIREGAEIEYRDSEDQITNQLRFRQSPGQIYGTSDRYTHATIRFTDKPLLEAHIGIKILGRGKVAHECDVCVLYHEEANRSRMNRVSPRSSQVIIAAECKHYTGNLNLVLARAFIGLDYVLQNLEGDCYFISNSDSESVAKTLVSARKKWALNIVPSSTNELQKLMSSFQINFQNFKAKY